ncbi:MAG: polysaccharide deacetylase family protein [Chryseolinea sp.]
MIALLNQPQLDYVFFHLNHHLQITPEIRERFFFARHPDEMKELSNRIVFLISTQGVSLETIKYIDDLPILFPVSNRSDFFYVDESNNVVFGHDILKSIFYLLSGYQEYENDASKDALNRFAFEDSIQSKLNIVQKPLVNYYIQCICEGIKTFCSHQNLNFSSKSVFKNFGFMLSHDIDIVDMYTTNYFLFKIKEVLQIKKSRLRFSMNLALGLKGMLKYFRLLKKDNPYWNFDFLRSLERKHNFRSIFFFLDKGVLHSDAYYSFDEKRMIDLFSQLQNERCEIGLHGTVESIDDRMKMDSSLKKLKESSQASVTGIRQHRLLWKHPETAIIQKSVGLEYDSTLGFAAHEGFRNSYCGPFKLYDFKNDQMLDLWEFPLNVMDVTLFAYRNYSPSTAIEKCIQIMEEVRKFNGVFTVLWHNSFFDEDTYPGVTNFYKNLLAEIAKQKPENILGSELVLRLNELNNA